jgi:hypothetical protein
MRIHYTGLTFACPIRVTAPNRGQTVRVPDPSCRRQRLDGSTAIGRVDTRLSEGAGKCMPLRSLLVAGCLAVATTEIAISFEALTTGERGRVMRSAATGRPCH